MLSDTHTLTPHPTDTHTKAYRYPLPKADIFLHAGDLTNQGALAEHQIIVDMLKNDVDAELKLVIAGNHDMTHDKAYYTARGLARHGTAADDVPVEKLQTEAEAEADAVRALYTDEAAVAAGIVYLEEEVRTFTLRRNGARFTVYASPYTPEYLGWAFAYNRDEDRFNPPSSSSSSSSSSRVKNWVPSFPNVDIMLTHGPPLGVLDDVVGEQKGGVGCGHLLRACERARPRLHVFGHIHESFGAVRRRWKRNDADTNAEVEAQDKKILQDPETVFKRGCCRYSMSGDAAEPLRFGEETLFVNASVVTVRYHADHAPWVVDLDLPRAAAAAAVSG